MYKSQEESILSMFEYGSNRMPYAYPFLVSHVCRARGDKRLMKEFFNSSEEIIQRLECKRSEKVVQMQARIVVGRPACTTCTGAAQSTARSTVARRAIDRSSRPTGMTNFMLGSVDRPVDRQDGSIDRLVSQQVNLLLVRFGLRF